MHSKRNPYARCRFVPRKLAKEVNAFARSIWSVFPLSIAQHGALLFINIFEIKWAPANGPSERQKERPRGKYGAQYEACTMPIQLLKTDVKFYDCFGMTWNKNNYIWKDRLEEENWKILKMKRLNSVQPQAKPWLPNATMERIRCA